MEQIAIIDFLGLTFRPPADNAEHLYLWSRELVKDLFGVEQVLRDTGRGWAGYRCRIDIDGVGLLAYGGNGNSVHLEITGTGCAQVKSWQELRDKVERYGARITRCDVACDDFGGISYNIAWCKSQYEAGGFDNGRGRSKRKFIDTDSGSTLYVGSRESGKLFRGYEKGKQQGETNSPWFRIEVEYRAIHREIPPEILTHPGAYLAGAYPCLSDCATEQKPIKTFAYSAAACLTKTLNHAKQQAGRGLHALLMLNGGDITDALARIHRAELPKRLTGYVKAVMAARAAGSSLARSPAMYAAHPSDVRSLEQANEIPVKWFQPDPFFPQAGADSSTDAERSK